MALDTSVVVAGLVAAHPHHKRARLWLQDAGAQGIELQLCLHGLAEVWATLTALPLDPRITGRQAQDMVDRLGSRVVLSPLAESTYVAAVQRCVDRRLGSGAVYDALHYLAAEVGGADALLTFNEGDFRRLADPSGPRVAVPPDPPSWTLLD